MLKFGFGCVPANSLQDAVDLARLGESLEFDTAWVPDQTFYRDPFLVIAACAQATSRIGLVLGVTNPFTRHPVQVARAAATLDEIASGRLSLGYGAGNRKQLINPLGLEQQGATSRCKEAVIITKRLLAGETVTYASETLQLEEIRLLTPPKPALPVFLAGRGPGILSAAGEVADGVIIGGLVSTAGLHYARRQVTLGEASRDPELGPLEVISWVTCHITDDLDATMEQVKPNVAHIIGGAPNTVLQEIGFSEERIATLKERYNQFGPEGAAALVEDGEVELLTIVGDAAQCARRIGALAAGGVQHVGFLLTQPTPEAQASFLRRFASEVMPQFR